MYHNIIFIGGIHGEGNGTVCQYIEKNYGLVHLSSSDILKWSELSPRPNNKLVKNINETQERLIRGLEEKIDSNKRYILDGHFCLFDSTGKPRIVPLLTFKKIAPVAIAVVTSNVSDISDRLSKRDNMNYNIDVLKEMQDREIAYAQSVADSLAFP